VPGQLESDLHAVGPPSVNPPSGDPSPMPASSCTQVVALARWFFGGCGTKGVVRPELPFGAALGAPLARPSDGEPVGVPVESACLPPQPTRVPASNTPRKTPEARCRFMKVAGAEQGARHLEARRITVDSPSQATGGTTARQRDHEISFLRRTSGGAPHDERDLARRLSRPDVSLTRSGLRAFGRGDHESFFASPEDGRAQRYSSVVNDFDASSFIRATAAASLLPVAKTV